MMSYYKVAIIFYSFFYYIIIQIQGNQYQVRNNKEYEALTKEIENLELDIQLAEKRIRENQEKINQKKEQLKEAQSLIDEKIAILSDKKAELDEIIKETEEEEKRLNTILKKAMKDVDERYLKAYTRIRNGVSNGLAVVGIVRNACGGCFNNIPPQRQLEIKLHKKILICEYCGRILVDDQIIKEVENEFVNK
jgi:predicted  nucleic acid-binding Zn-ribbon protein